MSLSPHRVTYVTNHPDLPRGPAVDRAMRWRAHTEIDGLVCAHDWPPEIPAYCRRDYGVRALLVHPSFPALFLIVRLALRDIDRSTCVDGTCARRCIRALLTNHSPEALSVIAAIGVPAMKTLIVAANCVPETPDRV